MLKTLLNSMRQRIHWSMLLCFQRAYTEHKQYTTSSTSPLASLRYFQKWANRGRWIEGMVVPSFRDALFANRGSANRLGFAGGVGPVAAPVLEREDAEVEAASWRTSACGWPTCGWP